MGVTIDELEGAVEAILFASGEAVSLDRISQALQQDVKTTSNILKRLSDKYQNENKGIYIIEINRSYQMCTNPHYYKYITAVLKNPQKKVLTQTLIETLAIIAYKQPITKAQIEQIRGVNADHAVNRLMEYNLIVEKGRLDAPYKPIVFGTSVEFLRNFGLQNLESLPEIPSNVERIKLEAEKEADEKSIN